MNSPADPAPPRDLPFDQPALLAALRARVARLENAGREAAPGPALVPLCDGLPVAGLARGGLHELLAASPGAGAGFAAVLLGLAGGTVLWIAGGAARTMPWPPGLARCGLPPERLVLLRADRPEDAFWAMEESLRCPAVGGALLALDARQEAMLTLTATRRLQLAAEAGGGIGLLLRPHCAQQAGFAAHPACPRQLHHHQAHGPQPSATPSSKAVPPRTTQGRLLGR